MTITEWRQATASFGKEISKSSLVSFEDRTIPAKDGFPLSCRLFNDHLSSDSPVFVFFPGCAFLFDFFEVNSAITSQIAEKVDVKVILVQFRLAPEYSIKYQYEVGQKSLFNWLCSLFLGRLTEH